MQNNYNCKIANVVLVNCLLMLSCTKKSEVSQVNHDPKINTFTVSRSAIIYDGMSDDSTVLINWDAVGDTKLNGDPVGSSGSKVSPMLTTTTTYQLTVTNGKTVSDTKTVNVSKDPIVELLVSPLGWRLSKVEQWISGTWQTITTVNPCRMDDRDYYFLNKKGRKIQGPNKCDPIDGDAGFLWRLNPDKNILYYSDYPLNFSVTTSVLIWDYQNAAGDKYRETFVH